MRILVVEDDEVFGLLIERLLKPYLSQGDTISVVRSMADADAYLAKYGAPDLVTLDLNLPGSRWNETLERVKDFRGQNGCVFVISGVTEEDVSKLSLEKGADGFIAKPFNEKGFLGNLRDTLRSLVQAPERYKTYSRIHKAISDQLEEKVVLPSI